MSRKFQKPKQANDESNHEPPKGARLIGSRPEDCQGVDRADGGCQVTVRKKLKADGGCQVAAKKLDWGCKVAVRKSCKSEKKMGGVR